MRFEEARAKLLAARTLRGSVAWIDGEIVEGLRIRDDIRFVPAGSRNGIRKFALLIPILQSESGEAELLLQRRSEIVDYPGRVVFPGGNKEAQEIALETALRETWEEMGLAAREVEVVARIPSIHLPEANGQILGILGFVENTSVVLRADPLEVAEIVRLRISDILPFKLPELAIWLLSEKNLPVAATSLMCIALLRDVLVRDAGAAGETVFTP